MPGKLTGRTLPGFETLAGLNNFPLQSDIFLKTMHAIFLIQLLAFWPVWRWYIATLRDPATDTSVVIALFTAIFFCMVKKPTRQETDISFRTPIILLLIYSVTFPWLPPFGHAVLAVITLSHTLNRWRFGTQMQPWLYGLLLMALQF